MNLLKARFSALIFVCITLFFGLSFFTKIRSVTSGENTCICSYDGLGYYIYLPQLFSKGSLFMEPQSVQPVVENYCGKTDLYQLHKMDNGNYVDVYHIGLSFLQLPAYLVGDVSAKISGYPQDGFSKPYHIVYLVNAWFFVLLGVWYSRKLFRLFFSELISGILLLLLFFGTNYYANTLAAFSLQHHYILALTAIFAYHFFKSRSQNFSGKSFVISAVVFGLITVVRPTHALLFIFPSMMMRKQFPDRNTFLKKVLLFPLSAFAWNIPQFLYWKIVGGSWLILNLHVEELIIVDPHILEFLFSFRKGWLVYTPMFLLLIPGFILLRKTDRKLFNSLLVTTAVFIFIMASWECWWYAYSFGSRAMIDVYPLLLIPIGFLIKAALNKVWTLVSLAVFTVMIFTLNGIQSSQYASGYISGERMTRSHYWYIFGRTSIADFSDYRMLIERTDLNWTERVEFSRDNAFRIESSDYFKLKKEISSKGGEDMLLEKSMILDKVRSDETQFHAEIEYEISDSTKSTVLRLETVSSYNAYDWQSVELALGKSQNVKQTAVVTFNLKDIHHRKDKLQIYLDNDLGGGIKIYRLNVTATSLVRN